MKCTFEIDAIAPAIHAAARVVKSNATVPIMSCLCLEASEETGIRLIATDLETALVSHIAGTCDKPGSVVVYAKHLAAIVTELDGEVIFQTKDTHLLITAGSAKFQLNGVTPDEFPLIVSPEPSSARFEIDGEVFRQCLRTVIYASVGNAKSGRHFDGLRFKFLAEHLESAASNGFQLALKYAKPSTPVPDALTLLAEDEETTDYVLSFKSVSVLLHTFKDAETLELVFDLDTESKSIRRLTICTPETSIVCRVADVALPDYTNAIPKQSDETGIASLNRSALMSAVRRVQCFTNPSNRAMVLQLMPDEETLHLSAVTPELGEAHETLPLKRATAPFRVGVDARAFLTTLQNMLTEEITLEYQAPLKPLLLRDNQPDEHLCIVMPLRLNA